MSAKSRAGRLEKSSFVNVKYVYYNERQVSIRGKKGKTMSDKDFIIIDEKEKEEEKIRRILRREDKAEVVQTEEKR